MKKIIENTVIPMGTGAVWFPSCFASVWMCIEGVTTEEQAINVKPLNGECCGSCVKNKLGLYHLSIQNLYAVVSGLPFMQLDLSNEEHLTPWYINRILDEYDDYIKFTMGFAGFSYERFEKNTDKAVVFDSIKKSINENRSVLMNFGPHYAWCVIIGYDDQNGTIYGLGGNDYWKNKPGSYEGDMFVTGHWYEYMVETVIITSKTAPTVTYDDVFKRTISILETMNKTGYYKRSVDFLKKNANFEGYDDSKYLELARRINQLIGLPIDNRDAGCTFNNLAKVETFKDRAQYFKRISALYDNNTGVCWIAWSMVGAFGSATDEDVVKTLAISPITRRAIADVIGVVIENNCRILDCLREMIGIETSGK
jgi:hypothetical protein